MGAAWDPTAQTGCRATRARFGWGGDGKLTAEDTDFAKFKGVVTGANGCTSVQTLAALGITKINLSENETRVVLADGSAVLSALSFGLDSVDRTPKVSEFWYFVWSIWQH